MQTLSHCQGSRNRGNVLSAQTLGPLNLGSCLWQCFMHQKKVRLTKKIYREIIINLHFYDQSHDPNLGRKHSFLPLIGVARFDFDALGNIFLPHRKFCDCRWMHTFSLLSLFSLKKKKLWFASLLKSSFWRSDVVPQNLLENRFSSGKSCRRELWRCDDLRFLQKTPLWWTMNVIIWQVGLGQWFCQ